MQRLIMLRNVTILPDNLHFVVKDKTTVADALRIAGVNIAKPCGGEGTCGKCKVFLNDVLVKSCDTYIESDVTIKVPDSVKLNGQKILTDIKTYDKNKNIFPKTEKVEINLKEPTLWDSFNDAYNLIKSLSEKLGILESNIYIEPPVMIDLPYILRKNNFKLNPTIYHEDENISIISLTDNKIFGLAIDIGTSTIAMALCDLKTCEVVDVYSTPNPQAVFGTDVISRIIFTEENKGGTILLKEVIIEAISQAIKSLAERVKISTDDIVSVVIAANTVMSHFLLGLPTDFLRREPYVPVTNIYPKVFAKDLGIPILNTAPIIIIPSVSSYVGGDVVAGVIATEIYKKSYEEEGLNLLVDVGTNGEIVLAGQGFMMACSCSAGPAFEGSGISCGSFAIRGAIDNVYFKDGKLSYDVLGNSKEAISICGSGLISLLSALLEAGIINRSGKFINNMKSYVISENVSITEADIQNLIRAKAALLAGMKIMVNNISAEFKDLNKILIAGGFGRSINIQNAVNIGMLPDVDVEKYSYIGNSSLVGALRVLNDRTIDIKDIANSITNFELSIGNEFMEEFIRACFLPHTDFSLFNINE